MLTSAAQAGRPGAVACLLGEVDRALPAPVDEDPEQECRDERREPVDCERREPVRLRPGRAVRRVAGVDLPERDEREDEQDQDLRQRQHRLQPPGELRAEDADRGHHDDDRHGERDHGPLRLGGRVPADEDVEVARPDVRERSDHENARRADRPAADPARPRPERPRHPREGRAGVLVGAVQVVERGRDQEHRHERGEHRGRRLDAHDHGHGPDHGGERVGGRGRRETDRERLREADRLVVELDRRLARRHGLVAHASFTHTCLIRVYSSIEYSDMSLP